MPVNFYKRPNGGRPLACLARIDVHELDIATAPNGSPVRPGMKSPWRLLKKDIKPCDHSHWHDKTSALASALLPFGGLGVVRPRRWDGADDPDIPNILSRGQLWPGKESRLAYGRVSNCHGNASFYWAAFQDEVALATGYALSDDGLWRQHSWCVAEGGKIVETTETRLLYVGFAMTADEALRFCAANAGIKPRLAKAPAGEPSADLAL